MALCSVRHVIGGLLDIQLLKQGELCSSEIFNEIQVAPRLSELLFFTLKGIVKAFFMAPFFKCHSRTIFSWPGPWAVDFPALKNEDEVNAILFRYTPILFCISQVWNNPFAFPDNPIIQGVDSVGLICMLCNITELIVLGLVFAVSHPPEQRYHDLQPASEGLGNRWKLRGEQCLF